MNGEQYWVYNWIDSQGIISTDRAREVLAKPSAMDDLREVGMQAQSFDRSSLNETVSVVAGRGIDLSGQLDCLAQACRYRQVDELFRKAWHYFDKVIVADAISHEIVYHFEESEERIDWLLGHIDVLLYLRKIGAAGLVEFREKAPACEQHWRKHASDVHLDRVLDAADNLIATLAIDAEIEVQPAYANRLDFAFLHPRFEHTVWGSIPKLPENQIPSAVAESVLRR